MGDLRANPRCGPVAREEIRMLTNDPSLNAALLVGAMTWPLMAGLSIVLWSKARAWRAEAAREAIGARVGSR